MATDEIRGRATPSIAALATVLDIIDNPAAHGCKLYIGDEANGRKIGGIVEAARAELRAISGAVPTAEFAEKDIKRHALFGADGSTACEYFGAPVGSHAVCEVKDCEGLAECVIWRGEENHAVCRACAAHLEPLDWEVG